MVNFLGLDVWRWVYILNPMASIITDYRYMLLYGLPPIKHTVFALVEAASLWWSGTGSSGPCRPGSARSCRRSCYRRYSYLSDPCPPLQTESEHHRCCQLPRRFQEVRHRPRPQPHLPGGAGEPCAPRSRPRSSSGRCATCPSTCPSGKTVGIIGNNGSGKSTALKLISGILRPTSGSRSA